MVKPLRRASSAIIRHAINYSKLVQGGGGFFHPTLGLPREKNDQTWNTTSSQQDEMDFAFWIPKNGLEYGLEYLWESL